MGVTSRAHAPSFDALPNSTDPSRCGRTETTPLASAAMIGVGFQFAAGPQWDGGLFGNESTGGFDQTLLLMFAGAALGFIGAGRYSLDSRMPGSIPLRGWRAGTIAIALGVIVGAIILIGFGVGLGGQPSFPEF